LRADVAGLTVRRVAHFSTGDFGMTTAAVAASGTPAPSEARRESVVYAVGGFRRLVICIVFLLLLPFYASLPAMLSKRIAAGQWDDVIGLGLLAAGFTAIMVLLLINMMFSLRARIDLGPSTVRMTLPTGRGPTPMLMYRTFEFPYGEIAEVETRREIYGGAIAPVMLRGARIVKKDGTVVKLGYDSEANTNAAFPYAEIAEQIAARAGLKVVDKGSVRRSAFNKMMGVADRGAEPEPPIEQAEIDRLNGQHRLFVWGLVIVLVALVAVGIARDIVAPPSSHSATPLSRGPSR
jgi:hypothetical protein